MKRLFLLLIGIVGTLITSGGTVSALGKTDITVSPAIREWVVARGTVVKKSFILTNTSDNYIPIESDAASLTPYQDENKQAFVLNAGPWMTLSEPDFILRPKETKRVFVTLKVPKNAEPGGHYATLYFRQLGPMLTSPHSDVVGSVGALNFVTVQGNIQKSLQPEEITVDTKKNTTTVAVRIRNVGNVHTFPTGKIIVKDWWGKEVKRISFPSGVVLPGTVRTYTASLRLPSAGVYVAYSELSLGNRRLRPLSATIWSLPWKRALLITVVLILGWFGVFRLRHRWRRAIRALFN